MELQERFKRHLQRSRFFSNHDSVLVAVSTGVDSMVLLELLRTLPLKIRPAKIIVAHVNHELRPQSKIEEEFIKRYCQNHQLQLVIGHWPKKDHPKHGTEEAAREFRYTFFAQIMQKLKVTTLLTAHHENDLAETILMKMVRGGQLDQMIGIADQRPFASGQIVRPLLPFKKAELYEYAHQHHITWYEDVTNQDLAIERNRFRHQIIPLLQKENSQLLSHLSSYHYQLADLLAWRSEFFNDKLRTMTTVTGAIDLTAFTKMPLHHQEQLLRFWLERHGVINLKDTLLTQLVNLVNNRQIPQKCLSLPENFQLVKDYAQIRLQKGKKISLTPQKYPAHVVKLGKRYPVNQTEDLLVSTQKTAFVGDTCQEMWLAPEQLPLKLRYWRPGDYLRLKDGGHQKVSRILIDQKMSQATRVKQLVLVDAHGTVVWLLNRKWSWFTRPANYRQKWRQLFIGKIHRGEDYE